MEALDTRRKAIKELAARGLGATARQPRHFAGQLRSDKENSVIVALPARQVAPIQNLTTGEFNYMVDYDPLDSADIS